MFFEIPKTDKIKLRFAQFDEDLNVRIRGKEGQGEKWIFTTFRDVTAVEAMEKIRAYQANFQSFMEWEDMQVALFAFEIFVPHNYIKADGVDFIYRKHKSTGRRVTNVKPGHLTLIKYFVSADQPASVVKIWDSRDQYEAAHPRRFKELYGDA